MLDRIGFPAKQEMDVHASSARAVYRRQRTRDSNRVGGDLKIVRDYGTTSNSAPTAVRDTGKREDRFDDRPAGHFSENVNTI